MNFFAEHPYFYMGVIAPSAVVFPVVFSIIRYGRLTPELKIAAWYMYLDGLNNLICTILARHWHNNMPLGHIFTAIEFTMLALLYKRLLNSTVIGKYINAAIGIFLILCVVNACFFQGLLSYNSYTKSVESVAMIFLSVAYFKKILDAPEIKDNDSTLIYINSGLLLYFSGSLTLFVLVDLISHNQSLINFIWNTHVTINIVMYLLFAVAFAKCKNER